MRNRILNYLASGIKPAQVATIVGCSPGYISVLLKDDSFRLELEAKVIDSPENKEEKDLDNKYISLEHNILRQVEDAIVGAELPALVRALEVVAKRQDLRLTRKYPAAQQPNALGTSTNLFVTVSLPSHALPPPLIELNEQKEILAINNKTLAPMSSDSVKGLFDRIKQQKAEASSLAAQDIVATMADPIKALADF